VFCAVGGVEPQSETVWRQADKYGVPRVAFINKMDRVGADFETVVKEIRDKARAKAYPVQYPLGQGELFTGVVDVIRRVEIVYNERRRARRGAEGPRAGPLKENRREAAPRACRGRVEYDDHLLEKYAQHPRADRRGKSGRSPQGDDQARHLVPITCGAAFKNKGVSQLLDAVVDFLPSPVEIAPMVATRPTTARRRSRAARRRGAVRGARVQDRD